MLLIYNKAFLVEENKHKRPPNKTRPHAKTLAPARQLYKESIQERCKHYILCKLKRETLMKYTFYGVGKCSAR